MSRACPEQQSLFGDVPFTESFTDKGNRRLHDIALDVSNPLHKWLHESITWLSSRRLFQSTVRDALRLILDLRAGHTEVLFELFPWVKEKVGNPNDELLEQIKVLLAARAASVLPAPQDTISRPSSVLSPIPDLEITQVVQPLGDGLHPSMLNFFGSFDGLMGSKGGSLLQVALKASDPKAAKKPVAKAVKKSAAKAAKKPVAAKKLMGADVELPPPDDIEEMLL